MTYTEHGHTDSMDGGTGLVNFLLIESDDEADGSSTATELNLNERVTEELALFLIEIVRDNAAGGGFWRGDLQQLPNTEDTSARVRRALGILEYSVVDHSFADLGLLSSIEIQDIQVPTSVEGQTTTLTWDCMSSGDRANVIAAMRDHLQEESSFWTSTDQRHLSSEVSQPGDTVEDYVERQLQMWRGEYVWSNGEQTHDYRGMMYLQEDHDTVEQALRQHLMERYSRNDPNREQNNPEVWSRNNLFEIRDLIDRAMDGTSVVAADGGVIDIPRILEISGDIAREMNDQDALHVEFGVPDGIRGDDTNRALVRARLREEIQSEVMMAVRWADEQMPVNQMNQMREEGERRLHAAVDGLRGQHVTDARVRTAAT